MINENHRMANLAFQVRKHVLKETRSDPLKGRPLHKGLKVEGFRLRVTYALV